MSNLKLEAGKYYRTRDGRKAYVDSIRTFNPFTPININIKNAALGAVEDVGARTWSLDGRYDTVESQSDLIAPWENPPLQLGPEHVGRRVKLGEGHVMLITSYVKGVAYPICAGAYHFTAEGKIDPDEANYKLDIVEVLP